ncbi:hypothetical protein [Synechococcus phage S-B68]|nr:hypothetical protein [Synechococcus phage S-B68]
MKGRIIIVLLALYVACPNIRGATVDVMPTVKEVISKVQGVIQ